MHRTALLVIVILLPIALPALADDPSAGPAWPPEHVSIDSRVPQRVTIQHAEPGPAKTVTWHPAWPHIVAMRPRQNPGSEETDRAVTLVFNKDATKIELMIPNAAGEQPAVVDTADTTQQFADGTWAFVASDAKMHGQRAALESHPGSFRIGFWTNPDDFITWDYTATRWGMYEVAVTYSLAGGKGSDITVAIGDAKATGTIKPTESWWHYKTARLGRVYLPDAGKKTLTVRGTKTGGAVMNLKAVILSPAPEGGVWPLKPADDGSILLHSKDAQIDGVTLRYEPKPEKNTLGFWSNPSDRARWEFESREGEFDVEVLQGCGKSHGGSEVEVRIGDEKVLGFTVEETSGWQNFKPRNIGSVKFAAGPRTLTLAPVRKAGAAVMDVRHVRLIPVKD